MLSYIHLYIYIFMGFMDLCAFSVLYIFFAPREEIKPKQNKNRQLV